MVCKTLSSNLVDEDDEVLVAVSWLSSCCATGGGTEYSGLIGVVVVKNGGPRESEWLVKAPYFRFAVAVKAATGSGRSREPQSTVERPAAIFMVIGNWNSVLWLVER